MTVSIYTQATGCNATRCLACVMKACKHSTKPGSASNSPVSSFFRRQNRVCNLKAQLSFKPHLQSWFAASHIQFPAFVPPTSKMRASRVRKVLLPHGVILHHMSIQLDVVSANEGICPTVSNFCMRVPGGDAANMAVGRPNSIKQPQASNCGFIASNRAGTMLCGI